MSEKAKGNDFDRFGIVAESGDNIHVIDERDQGLTIAVLRFVPGKGVALMWMDALFTHPTLSPMPGELRETIVKTLRFHADKLESKAMDARMREIMRPQS